MNHQAKLITVLLLGVLSCMLQAQENELQETAQSQDSLNAARMETIFQNVDELKNITVTVKNGVVRLEGRATSDDDRNRAESVAQGLPDVVYVDNDIEVATDIKERLSPSVSRFNELVTHVRKLLPLLGVAAGILLVFWLLSRLVAWVFRSSPLLRTNRLLRGIVEKFIRVAVVMMGLYLGLEVLGATAIVGAALGAAGVAGLALSFAFRDIIENFLASVLLSLRQPFRIKDVVDVNGSVGKVVRLTSSETVLMTLDGNHIRIPNADVFKGKVINYTRNPERRFDVVVGVSSDEDLLRAEEVGLQTLRDLQGVLAEPPPTCYVDELGDSNVAMRFHGWVNQSVSDFGKVRSNATRLIKVVFDSEEIGMPNPIYEINLHQQDAKDNEATVEEKRERHRTAELAKQASVEDLSPDTHIDRQIDQEKLAEEEEDLLSDENKVVDGL